MSFAELVYLPKNLNSDKMEVTVIYEKREHKKEIPENTSVKEVLDLMDISSETVVVKRNNEIIIDEENLDDEDVIEVIRVIYGG